ncbi:MAG: transporter substrate-binding domain-containing protein [Bacteroidales bacterium]|nr:transporter substrate-binding domain-containing protein [Bacteroidales bacterium]
MNIRHTPIYLLWAILAAMSVGMAMVGCGHGHSSEEDADSIITHPLPDTLRVVTLYSPTSYFIYREETMGYDYDLVQRFATDKGLTLQLEVAPSLSAAIEMVDSGLVDLIAYEVPVTAEYRPHIVACGIESITHQVLVQPKKSANDTTAIRDVTQLVGRDIYVEAGSKYHHRLNNLNDELGGGINIHPIDRDTLITEDLIAMVSKGEIPLTVVDSDIARLNKTYYNDLDITLEISFPQRAAWGVAPDHSWLGDTINEWMAQAAPRQQQTMLLKRYFEMSKSQPSIQYKLDLSRGRVSPFDALFKRYAKEVGYDWRLLAAQGFAESRFDSTQVSWAGARGIMQIMPGTARAHGLSMEYVSHNEPSIATAAKIIASLDRSFASRVPDRQERMKFIVAAYNSGMAHILDAIALAEKYGLDPQRWDGNVAQALLMKSKPEYYNDPVCRYGYFRGRQTTEYVRTVFGYYDLIRQKIKL